MMLTGSHLQMLSDVHSRSGHMNNPVANSGLGKRQRSSALADSQKSGVAPPRTQPNRGSMDDHNTLSPKKVQKTFGILHSKLGELYCHIYTQPRPHVVSTAVNSVKARTSKGSRKPCIPSAALTLTSQGLFYNNTRTSRTSPTCHNTGDLNSYVFVAVH